MPITAHRSRLVVAVALVLGSGCGPGGDRGSVRGKMTLDNVPVAAGSITFLPIEGTQGPSAGAVIQDGEYEIVGTKGPVAGVYRVEIRAPRKTGRKVRVGSPAPPGTRADETVESVPARYNKRSELRQEVKAGKNTCDFELATQPRRQ